MSSTRVTPCALISAALDGGDRADALQVRRRDAGAGDDDLWTSSLAAAGWADGRPGERHGRATDHRRRQKARAYGIAFHDQIPPRPRRGGAAPHKKVSALSGPGCGELLGVTKGVNRPKQRRAWKATPEYTSRNSSILGRIAPFRVF
jgi:hypothetical protein